MDRVCTLEPMAALYAESRKLGPEVRVVRWSGEAKNLYLVSSIDQAVRRSQHLSLTAAARQYRCDHGDMLWPRQKARLLLVHMPARHGHTVESIWPECAQLMRLRF